MNRKEFLSTMSSAALLSGATYLPKLSRKIESTEPKIIRKEEGKQVNVIGDMQTFKLTGQDTDHQFTLIEENNVPGTMIPMHIHSNEDEVFTVLSGQMELTVAGETTILNAGDIGYGPRGIPHSWKIVGDQSAKVLLSVFPAGIEIMFEELSQLPAGPPDFSKLAAICGRYGIQFV